MVNVFFELDRLRIALQDKGVDDRIINNIVAKARREIEDAIHEYGQDAIDSAVEVGVQKRSPEFINQLHLDGLNFEVTTETGRLNFSEPPRPMLPFLLKNAKPMKDGTGFYKVIPVGKPGDRAKVSASIIDAQKKIVAERAERARERQKAMAPTDSKINFRTATTKQDIASQWVMPAQEKDFTEDMEVINEQLAEKINNTVRDIIEGYLEMF